MADWRLSPGEYLLGVMAIGIIVGASIAVGVVLRRRLLPGWQGPPAVLATLVLATATLLLSAELLGSLGLFTLPAYLLILIVLVALSGWGGFLPPSGGGSGDHGGGAMRPIGRVAVGHLQASRPVLALAALVAGAVFVRALLTTITAYDGGMSGFDTHWYHGPFTALFLQSGDTLALNNSIAPQYLSWFYPQNSELLQAIAILPFDRDLLSPGLNLLWLAGSMLAAWCIGRPFKVAPLSLIGACLILGSGLLSDQAGEMRNDIPAVFFVMAAAALAVNAKEPTRPALAVIGLAAGMAAGTKLNYLATAGALVVLLPLALPRGRRLSSFTVLFGAAFIGGGYWYLRNLIHSDNPLPWITSAGPLDLPGPSQEIGGRASHGVIEYLFDAGVWRDWFLPGLREALTLAWPLILLAAAAATLALLLRPRLVVHVDHRRGGENESLPLGLALALTILATVGAWLVAPASAEGPAGEPVGFVSGLRYLAPALALALALGPVAFAPWLSRLSGGAHGAVTAGRNVAQPPLTSGLRRAVAALAVVALIIGGYVLQRTYLEHRYAAPDFATPGLNRAFAEASLAAPKPPGAPPVAVTATRIYAFFGPDLAQPVAYVGVAEPHGGFRRPIGCAEWRQAVNETGAKQLIVAWDRLGPGQAPLPPEAAWIATDPAARLISSGGGAARFELARDLNPGACP